MDPSEFFSDALALPHDGAVRRMSELLAAEFPGKFLFETDSTAFNLESFAYQGHCKRTPKPGIHTQWDRDWSQRHRNDTAKALFSWHEVRWKKNTFDVVVMTHFDQFGRQANRFYILGDAEKETRAFFRAVAEFSTEVKSEVLVYDGGCFSKDEDLFEAIKIASFDNLVLAGDLKELIRDDIDNFFRSKETYEKYRIPWKRGVLFLGPPGNGKTHAVKAIISASNFPAIYVKSFKAEHSTDHHCIRDVFARARAIAPCILVLEDLDSLIDDDNRSFFLNEMDGFASNAGILTLATTNHPERLDPAILDRPSRFDRKYGFQLPSPEERTLYVRMFSGGLEANLQLTEEGVQAVVAATDDYSFAYLKELFLSSMMRWIHGREKTTMDLVMIDQANTLRQQMATDPEPTPTVRSVPRRRMPYPRPPGR